MTTDPVPETTTTGEERNWSVAAHLSGFLAAYVALGVLGPTVVYFIKAKDSSFVRAHAIEAINFNITVLIAIAVSLLLVIVGIGLILLLAVGVAYLVCTILGAMAASRGELYRYPLTLRLLK